MSDIVLVGINHKTAPVELRECIAFSKEESVTAVQTLLRQPDLNEVILFSTCNRVEVLLVTDNNSRAISTTKEFIADFNKIPLDQFENALYIHEGDEAVRHVFRVASSLDSMVVGEPQILGQIKDAYRTASAINTSGVILNRLLHRTFFVSKRIRTETGIGDRAVSISFAAVELGRKIFGTLEGHVSSFLQPFQLDPAANQRQQQQGHTDHIPRHRQIEQDRNSLANKLKQNQQDKTL